jgi:hypothetical protein
MNRAAFEHERSSVAIVAHDFEHLLRDTIVLVPGKIESAAQAAPGIEAPVGTTPSPALVIQASLLEISTTRTAGGSCLRALTYCVRDAATVTGSKRAIALATAANATCAGLAPRRQLSVLSGQSSQHPAWRSNSPGMRKPWRAGVPLIVLPTETRLLQGSRRRL